jgi:cytochrome d ubiquinol oxidase subunit II
LFYATSFGGAYWVWVMILFTFIVQAVSYEFRSKPSNLLGEKVYEGFLCLNGSLGIVLIGAAVGTFFTGASFRLSEYNFVTWGHPLRGLEAAFSLFNLSLGFFLMFNARVLGSMYLVNNIDFTGVPEMEKRLRSACLRDFFSSVPFLLFVLGSFVLMSGYSFDQSHVVALVERKYLTSLQQSPWIAGLLLSGIVFVLIGVLVTAKAEKHFGIWTGGLGTVLVGMAVFSLAGFNNTPFYPSRIDMQSSLTIFNASSSHYTLTVMTHVALFIPVVLAYIVYVWHSMNKKKVSIMELDEEAY